MKTQILLIFLFLFSFQNLNSQSNFIHNSKIGLGVNYGGQHSGLLGEITLGTRINRTFSVNLRTASNFNSRLKTFRIGGGVEIHPFTMGKVIPSIGAEIYHKSQIFDGFEESQSFRNIQIPISVKYYISQISALEIAIVSNNTKYSSSSDTVIRFAYYYNLR